MKRMIVILLLRSLILCGCNKNKDILVELERVGTASIPSDSNYGVYIDKATRVMYTRTKYGMSHLVNADGTPMVYEGGVE